MKTSTTVSSAKTFRPCVLGVFCNAKGQVLVCERADFPGSWQLPQGGVDAHEKAEEAILREMEEELGVHQFRIVATALAPVSYEFPEQLQQPISQKYRGQSQTWYLMEFLPGCQPDLKFAKTKEFCNWRWVSVEDALKLAIAWKRASYKSGFEKFYLL